jgi:GNAT superfamily N-acetyltransferase
MLRLRLMNEADLPPAMRLKEANGWNQTEADWRRYLDLQPDGCFVAFLDDHFAGTLTTCIFGPVAWIAMVLVDASFRRQGIGMALMQRALGYLESQAVGTVRLDATPLGRPLYEKLGFRPHYLLQRYEGVLPPADAVDGVEPLGVQDIDQALLLDREVTGTDRRKLILRLLEEFPAGMYGVRRAGSVEGFLGARPGARALQIGPCMASGKAGLLLLQHAQNQHGGKRVFIDIPTENGAGVGWAENAGLAPQRPLLRMVLGTPLDENIAGLWASSGPEMG